MLWDSVSAQSCVPRKDACILISVRRFTVSCFVSAVMVFCCCRAERSDEVQEQLPFGPVREELLVRSGSPTPALRVEASEHSHQA